MSHPESVQLLSNFLNTFPPRSAKTKSEFESKTAAIHAETSAQASYDLKEIKADALWLSEQAGIDEISALRTTVLEWQSRPATRLLAGFTEEETTSLQGAAGAENFRVSLAGPSLADVLSQRPDEDASSFASGENRRLRLRELYLSERVHIVKTARKLLTLHLQSDIETSTPPSSEQNKRTQSLCKLGGTVFRNKLEGEGWFAFVQACIEAIKSRLSALETDGGWLAAEECNEAVENMWRTTFVEEILHIVQTLFLQLQASASIPTADLLLSWLRVMVDYNFLQSLQVVSSIMSPTSSSSETNV